MVNGLWSLRLGVCAKTRIEISYSEFCKILRRLGNESNNNWESVRFRIDYRTIWKGITGKEIEIQ